MYVLAVTRHIGDAEEVEPSAEQERELLDADEGRCEDVSEHHLGEHQGSETEPERDDQDVKYPLENRFDGDQRPQSLRQRALRDRCQMRRRLRGCELRIVDKGVRADWRARVLFRFPVHLRASCSMDRPGASAPGRFAGTRPGSHYLTPTIFRILSIVALPTTDSIFGHSLS